MSDFIAQIQAVLDTSKVEAQLKNLQKNQKIKLDVELSGESANLSKLLEKQMSGLNTTALKTGQNVGKNYTTALQRQIETVAKTQRNAFSIPLDNLSKQQKVYSDLWNKELSKKSNINYGKNQQLKMFDDYLDQLQIRSEKVAQIQKRISQGFLDVEISGVRKSLDKYAGTNNDNLKFAEESYKKLISLHKELKTGISNDGFNKTLSDKDILSKYKQYTDIYEKIKNQTKLLANETAKIPKPFSILDATTASNKTLTWLNNNTKAAKEFGEALTELANKQKSATSSEELADYNKQFKAIVSTAQEKGAVGNSFWAEIKRGFSQIGQFVGVYGILQNGVDIVKQMAQAVIDVDTAMTNLYKVTDETSNKYNEFLSNAGKTAKDVGRDISSYITQTSEWAKLGYSMDSSANLAKISSIYSNVGEVDDKTAVSDLVTVMKAYDIQYDDALSIVDKYNKLENEFATSAKDLGEGMSHAASMMSLGGTDLNKALAMLTGGAEITQSAGELGNALKIGQMRIQGMKGDLEALGEESEGLESVSKIQTHILNLTKGQVNIMDSADPTKFRDYYDILEDVSKVWNQLDQTKRADLLETMFGKNRGNQGAAVIQAFQSGQVQKAYAATLNAEGSAMQEQERWLESIEAKIQQFKASFQNLSNTTLSSDLFKGAIDSGTAFLDILTNILDVGNGIPALLGTIGAVSFFKNLDLFYKLV